MADETKSVADVLEDAADILWLRGRCRFDRFGRDGRVCIVGAIQKAREPEKSDEVLADLMDGLGDKPYERMYQDPATLALNEFGVREGLLRNVRFTIDTWNDDLDETPENDELVIDTLRRCAKAIRNEASV